jgi:hypothetical protein
MGARYDPWAPEPGFEPRAAPSARDEFAPLDLQTFDLRDFLRSCEVQKALHSALGPPDEPVTETVILPDGMRGELKQRAANEWELTVNLRRDFYQIFTGTHSKVLERAHAAHGRDRARPS